MKIKAILFDLDNTLIDFTKFKKKATYAAARAMVKAGLKTDARKLAKKLLEFYYSYGIESDDPFEQYMLKEFKQIDYRALAAGINAYLHEKYIHLKPYPGVVETLRAIKKRGLKLAVVSDGLRVKAWMRLNAAGIDKYFDAVVTFEDTGQKKPAREPFLKACDILNVRPEECLFVGDWLERDIEGSKVLGMETCLVRYGQTIRDKAKADYEINEIVGLLELIK